ncbi:hypothetical protein C1H46_033986 [Malus baccata]|uniref:Uncharacterized protein n=1 Tax=Malus baccata TaxID=106549 RepID=A0A540L1V9_MALBA|nr:hypothetical protein C1H46_033986 [Malus baccata]
MPIWVLARGLYPPPAPPSSLRFSLTLLTLPRQGCKHSLLESLIRGYVMWLDRIKRDAFRFEIFHAMPKLNTWIQPPLFDLINSAPNSQAGATNLHSLILIPGKDVSHQTRPSQLNGSHQTRRSKLIVLPLHPFCS